MTVPNAHRGGVYTPLTLPVKVTGSVPTNAIASGDLIAIASGKAIPQVSWPYTTDEATTQTAFAAAFQGMSNSRSRASTTDPRDLTIEVNSQGYFDINVEALGGGYALGDMIGIGTDGASACLTTCKKVSTLAKAIGRIVETPTNGTAAGLVRVELLNTPHSR